MYSIQINKLRSYSVNIVIEVLLCMCILKMCQKDLLVTGHFVPLDILFPWMIGLLDNLYLWTLCLSGCFVPPDVLSKGCYVSGRYVSGCFFSPMFCPSRRLYGHRKMGLQDIIYTSNSKCATDMILMRIANTTRCHNVI